MTHPVSASLQQPPLVEDRAIDMAEDEAIHRRPARQEEIRDLLRLIFMAARMDVDGRAGFLLGDQRALHHAALQFGPWRLAADLADHAGANIGVPGPLQHLADHLGRKIVDRSRRGFACPGSRGHSGRIP